MAVGLFVLTAVLQATVPAQADNTITLPPGSSQVKATVQSKDAGNQLEFGLFKGPGTFDPTCTDCAPGDEKTYTGLSGSIIFYLKDHNSNCGVEAFFSTDGKSAQVVQVNDGKWTISWDDGGAPSQTDPPCSRDGDFNDLVVDIQTIADLSITKADGNPDAAPGFGPDPVSSGGTVAYRLLVSNGGPDAATGISVTDIQQGGTVIGASGMDWLCTVTSSSAHCTRAASLASGATAPAITVRVQAPTTSSGTTISDTATVTANESDPNNSNNEDTDDTTVTPAGTQDFGAGFCTGGATTCTVTTDTGNGATATDPTVSTITIPGGSGAAPQAITMTEALSPAGFCGGAACSGQVLTFTSSAAHTFEGVTDPRHPAIVTMIFDKTVKGGSQVYVDKGSGPVLVPNCKKVGIANPHPCVSERNILLPNGDRKFVILFLQDDPTIGKR
jgi:hypothetical protein